MNDLIETLRRRCREKPGSRRESASGEGYAVLEGFLDGFARFILTESPPVILLRCKNSDLERIQRNSGSIRVSDRMRWETVGWSWSDVVLDGSISLETLVALIDESYQIVCDSLDESQKVRLSLLTRNLRPTELFSELIKAHGLSRRRAEVEGLARPALLLKTKKTVERTLVPGRTKIGGRPDLPSGQGWPTYRDGKHLAFLAQINLAEVPRDRPLGALPERGILAFFSVFGWQVEGDADPKLPEGEYSDDWTRVLYIQNDPASLVRSSVPATVNSFPAAEVEFLPKFSLPTDPKEPDVARLKWKKPVREKYLELVDSFRSACNFQLGYPNRNLLLGHADYEQEFVDAVAEQNLQLLFQLSSDDCAEMCWGDGGYIYFWIRPQDLERGDFGRVHTDYQCG